MERKNISICKNEIKKEIINWKPIFFAKNAEEMQQAFNHWESALCEKYYGDVNSYICCGCPIMDYTGTLDCKNTPYVEFYNNKAHENAREELLFLMMLYKYYL